MTPDNPCALSIDSICYIEAQSETMLTNGDIAYNDNQSTNPIMGGNRYYKVSFAGDQYGVQIDNSGIIGVNTLCIE